jgi:predicted ATPase/transcriptional regulator with XRE-family HTH domain
MTTAPTASFGDLLRRYRVAAGLSQEALAERARLSPRAISDLERGLRRAPYQETVRLLADALDLPPADRTTLEATVNRRRGARAAPSASPAHQPSSNLPVTLTSFVGRAQELMDLRQLLAGCRLLTLIGAGGVGKTRLALAVAADLLPEYPDGVRFADLAPLTDPALVPHAVAAVMGVQEQPGRPVSETLATSLQPMRLLLLLDNCEHLIDACAELTAALLSACPHLCILVTSRETLAIAGETVYRVPSLSVPPDARRGGSQTRPGETRPHAAPSTQHADLDASDAICLFLERATAALPAFVLTEANADAIAQICRRLDGIPLAIELAAARVTILTPEQIAARLDDCFRLLISASRTALPRQQTLRATLDWSYALLTEPEQALLRRLAVFAGRWTLEAAEAVCDDSEKGKGQRAKEGRSPLPFALRPSHSVLDTLTRLADKSLVLVEQHHGEAWYRDLEPIRQYARERLLESGEAAAVQARHQDWYLALARKAQPQLQGAAQSTWFARLELEHDNLRAALAWSLTQPNGGEVAQRLGASLVWFWYTCGHAREGDAWLRRALAHQSTPAVRAAATGAAAWLAHGMSDYAAGKTLYEASLRLYTELGNRRGQARVLCGLGNTVRAQGDIPLARAGYQQSVQLFEAIATEGGGPAPGLTPADQSMLGAALIGLGDIALLDGEHNAARSLFERALTLFRRLGDRTNVGWATYRLGDTALRVGDTPAARRFFSDALALYRETGAKRHLCGALNGLGRAALSEGDTVAARARYEESLAAAREQGAPENVVDALLPLGRVAYYEGDLDGAAALLEEALALATGISYASSIAWSLHMLGRVALTRNDPDRAAALLARGLAHHQQIADKRGIVACLENTAAATVLHQPPRAARLLGAAAALRETIGLPLPPIDRPDYDRCLAAVRAALSPDTFAAMWHAGRSLSLDQAIAEARGA